jgi:hypothetical protein
MFGAELARQGLKAAISNLNDQPVAQVTRDQASQYIDVVIGGEQNKGVAPGRFSNFPQRDCQLRVLWRCFLACAFVPARNEAFVACGAQRVQHRDVLDVWFTGGLQGRSPVDGDTQLCPGVVAIRARRALRKRGN